MHVNIHVNIRPGFKKKECHLNSNDFGFIWAGISNMLSYKTNVWYNLSCKSFFIWTSMESTNGEMECTQRDSNYESMTGMMSLVRISPNLMSGYHQRNGTQTLGNCLTLVSDIKPWWLNVCKTPRYLLTRQLSWKLSSLWLNDWQRNCGAGPKPST